MFCYCMPLRYVCIFFGIAQLTWAITQYSVNSADIEAKMCNVGFGICAALLIYGATKRKHYYLWPSIILVVLVCLLTSVLVTILLRDVLNGNYNLYYVYHVESTHDYQNVRFIMRAILFLIVVFTLNYAVYSYAIQLQQVDKRAKKIEIQQRRFVHIV